MHGKPSCKMQQCGPQVCKNLLASTLRICSGKTHYCSQEDKIHWHSGVKIYAIHRKLWCVKWIMLSDLPLCFKTGFKIACPFLLQTFYEGENSDLPRKCLEIFQDREDIFYLFNLQRFVTRCILFSYICWTFHICVKHYFILICTFVAYSSDKPII